MNAHDMLVLTHRDPCVKTMCPQCGKKFVGEQGVTFLCRYKIAGADEWITGFLVFCSHLCILLSQPAKGQC